MPLLHRYLPVLATLCLASCRTLPMAPEPAEFSRTEEELRRDLPSTHQLGIVTLHARSIRSSQDEKGHAFHLATGDAVLVKKSDPAIQAQAPEILLNADFAEVRGRSVVKKGGLLYLGESDSSKIIIDGVRLLFEGPHSTKRAGPAKVDLPVTEPPPQAEPAPEPAEKPKPVVVSKPKPVTVSKPTPKPAAKPTIVKPATPALPDRARLLQLMREPKE